MQIQLARVWGNLSWVIADKCFEMQRKSCSHHLEGSLRSGRSPCPPSSPAGSPCSPPPASPPPWWWAGERTILPKKFHNFSTCSPSFPPPTALALTATKQHTAATTKILITDHNKGSPHCVKGWRLCHCVCAQFLGRRSTAGSCGALCARRPAAAPRKVPAHWHWMAIYSTPSTLPSPHLVVKPNSAGCWTPGAGARRHWWWPQLQREVENFWSKSWTCDPEHIWQDVTMNGNMTGDFWISLFSSRIYWGVYVSALSGVAVMLTVVTVEQPLPKRIHQI